MRKRGEKEERVKDNRVRVGEKIKKYILLVFLRSYVGTVTAGLKVDVIELRDVGVNVGPQKPQKTRV